MKILAAIQDDAAARPVLDTAVLLGGVLAVGVEAVHVRTGEGATARQLASDAKVPLVELHLTAVPEIIDTLDATDVLLAVVGARGVPGGPRPAGSVAIAVLERTTKPVVVVPPEVSAPQRIARVLVPLDGTAPTDHAAEEAMRLLSPAGVEVDALHVFDRSTTPQFLDRPDRDLDMLGRELLSRLGAREARLTVRSGEAAPEVIDLATGRDIDMIVLGWSQDFSAGHGKIVREILARAPVPVLLMPVAEHPVLADR